MFHNPLAASVLLSLSHLSSSSASSKSRRKSSAANQRDLSYPPIPQTTPLVEQNMASVAAEPINNTNTNITGFYRGGGPGKGENDDDTVRRRQVIIRIEELTGNIRQFLIAMYHVSHFQTPMIELDHISDTLANDPSPLNKSRVYHRQMPVRAEIVVESWSRMEKEVLQYADFYQKQDNLPRNGVNEKHLTHHSKLLVGKMAAVYVSMKDLIETSIGGTVNATTGYSQRRAIKTMMQTTKTEGGDIASSKVEKVTQLHSQGDNEAEAGGEDELERFPSSSTESQTATISHTILDLSDPESARISLNFLRANYIQSVHSFLDCLESISQSLASSSITSTVANDNNHVSFATLTQTMQQSKRPEEFDFSNLPTAYKALGHQLNQIEKLQQEYILYSPPSPLSAGSGEEFHTSSPSETATRRNSRFHRSSISRPSRSTTIDSSSASHRCADIIQPPVTASLIRFPKVHMRMQWEPASIVHTRISSILSKLMPRGGGEQFGSSGWTKWMEAAMRLESGIGALVFMYGDIRIPSDCDLLPLVVDRVKKNSEMVIGGGGGG